jgi:type 1 glutamine amidotransferase
MRKSVVIGALVFVFAVTASPQAESPKRNKLLAIGLSAGFQHDSVSHGLATIWKIGQQSGLWDTFIRTDTQLLTKKKLGSNAKNIDYFDAVMFYTTGELPMDDEQKAALMSFVKDDGKGFLGTHSATDTFYKWPEYGEMVGGYFNDHPWHRR